MVPAHLNNLQPFDSPTPKRPRVNGQDSGPSTFHINALDDLCGLESPVNDDAGMTDSYDILVNNPGEFLRDALRERNGGVSIFTILNSLKKLGDIADYDKDVIDINKDSADMSLNLLPGMEVLVFRDDDEDDENDETMNASSETASKYLAADSDFGEFDVKVFQKELQRLKRKVEITKEPLKVRGKPKIQALKNDEESMANQLRRANYIAHSDSSFAEFPHLVEQLNQSSGDPGDTFYSDDACKRLTDLTTVWTDQPTRAVRQAIAAAHVCSEIPFFRAL